MRVFFTVDVEVWCDSWNALDRTFGDSFSRYIYGPTSKGDYGLPFKLALLRDHGLAGVFFVEPLFATRFGMQPLEEIVGLINDGNQEVQLHLHTEWVDEALERLLPGVDGKRQYLWMFSKEEQVRLIAAGNALLQRAGARAPSAFRAGSFGLGRDTWSALRQCGFRFDSSYNPSMIRRESGILVENVPTQPFEVDQVFEYPVTVYRDGFGRLRHAQLTASAYRELERLLWHAAEAGWGTVVIVSHSFELLNSRKDRPDRVVVERFRKLCTFLDRNRATFVTSGFSGLEPETDGSQPPPANIPVHLTGLRVAEQVWRRIAA